MINRTTKNKLHSTFPRAYALASITWNLAKLTREGQLKEDGYFESLRRRAPVDGDGAPIPWYTYSAIAFLEARLPGGTSVFEFGAGNSTLWWAKRCKHVTSCEHDADWYARVRYALPGNCELIHVDLDAGYDKSLQSVGGHYDVIAIDGRKRSETATSAPGHLTQQGIIIFDDSERARYSSGIETLRKNGFNEVFFAGMRPFSRVQGRTSIFYKDKNCLGL